MLYKFLNKFLPNKIGHLSSVPNKLFKPNIEEIRIEIVITNWYIVPIAPLKRTGEISVKYIGAKPEFNPLENKNIII